MEEEFELENSPLSRELTHDGVTVDIKIYRGGDEDWSLEVVNEIGTSTVWDDLFPTDKEALAEAMRTIEEEGISTFVTAAATELKLVPR